MFKRLILVFTAVMVFVNLYSQENTPAGSILSKTIGMISNAKGVEAGFTIYNSGYSGKGEIKCMGDKFNVRLPDVEVWYNGKDLYTYNERTSETTVVTPTAEELSESNPLAYVTGAAKNYNVSFSTVKKAGKNVLELLPKGKGDVKRITITLRKSDNVPEKIVVEPTNGNPVTADIHTFRTGVNLSAKDFEYPKSKYPKAELIDLR